MLNKWICVILGIFNTVFNRYKSIDLIYLYNLFSMCFGLGIMCMSWPWSMKFLLIKKKFTTKKNCEKTA